MCASLVEDKIAFNFCRFIIVVGLSTLLNNLGLVNDITGIMKCASLYIPGIHFLKGDSIFYI